MGIRKILTDLYNGLRTDSTLTDYCNTTFGKPQTVYLGFNPEDPPGTDVFPVIIIAAVDSREKSHREESRRIRIGINIENDEITQTGDNTVYEGFLDCEELTEEVENAIGRLSAKLDNITFTGQTLEETLFDNFAAEIAVIVKNLRPQRGHGR